MSTARFSLTISTLLLSLAALATVATPAHAQQPGEPNPEAQRPPADEDRVLTEDQAVPAPPTDGPPASPAGGMPSPASPEPPAVPVTPNAPMPPTDLLLPEEDSAPPTPQRWLVRSGSNQSDAFVYGDSNHLITTASVVRHRGSVRVIAPESGASFEAEVAVVRPDQGIALIRVEAPLGQPLRAAAGARVGDAVYSVGAENSAVGIVLAVRGERLELSGVCRAGAALMQGSNVVGVCTSRNSAVDARAFDALWEGRGADDRGPWRTRLTLDLRYRIQKGFESVLAGELGLGIVGWDRLGFAIRTGYGGDANQDDGPQTLVAPIEITGEVQLHQAFRVAGVPIRLVLGAGAMFRVQRTRTTQTFAEFEAGCDLSAGRCPVTYSEEQNTDTEYRVLPNLRAEINLGVLSLSYVASFDIDEISATTHSLGLGFAL